jgi:hypothetical protein
LSTCLSAERFHPIHGGDHEAMRPGGSELVRPQAVRLSPACSSAHHRTRSRADFSAGRKLMPRVAYAELEDDVCGMELPDHAAARELAAKVMRGLLRRTGGSGQWKSGSTGVGCGIFRSMRYRGRPLIKLKLARNGGVSTSKTPAWAPHGAEEPDTRHHHVSRRS